MRAGKGLVGILCLSTLLTWVPRARASDLPVPDIRGTIAALRGQGQDERYRFVSKLYHRHYEERDVKVLGNLLDFSLAARAMAHDLKLGEENDYDYVMMLSLLDLSLLGLSMHAPVNAPALSENYRRMHGAQSRFKILNYWHRRVESMESIPTLTELMNFGEAAMAWSDRVERGEEKEYIPKKALTLLEDASARLVALNPVFEGVYDVAFRCEGEGCPRLPSRGRMVVLHSRGEAKVVTTFTDAQGQGLRLFDFLNTRLEKGGAVLHGVAGERSVRAGEFETALDAETGKVKGWLRTSGSPKYAVIEGKQLWSPAAYARDGGAPSAVEAQDISGVYEGKVEGRPGHSVEGTLIIKRSGVGSGFMASFIAAYGESFPLGEYVKARGVLSLVSARPHGQYVRWTLAHRGTRAGKPLWKGVGYSTRWGELVTLEFQKVGETRDP